MTSFHTGAIGDAVVEDRIVMRLGSYAVALLSRLLPLVVLAVLVALGSTGCGGKHQEAKVAESDPWAGYKGTYAPGAADPPASADDKPATKATTAADTNTDAKPGKKPKGGKRGKKGAAADAASDTPAAAPDKPVSAPDSSSPSALYGDGTAAATTTGAATDDTTAAPKKPAAPAQ
jgi:hypothetical protein